MRKHLLNELVFQPVVFSDTGDLIYYDVYIRVINKDDSFSLERVGVCANSDEKMCEWCDWYDKYKAPYFEHQLRVRELRREIRKFFSNLFKKDEIK